MFSSRARGGKETQPGVPSARPLTLPTTQVDFLSELSGSQMVSGQQAAGSEGARAVEEAARLPGDGSKEEQPQGLATTERTGPEHRFVFPSV